MPLNCHRRRSAAERTALLHHLLLTRHLAERNVTVPGGLTCRLGEEAVNVAVSVALGPLDEVVTTPFHPPTGLFAILVSRPAGRSSPEPTRHVSISIERTSAGDETAREAVNSLDVEDLLSAVQQALGAVRTGDCARAVLVRLDESADPIDVLVTRMRIDHQLDDNALRAIDDDARQLARAA
ncbi:hypothetical protein GCM10010435_42280 [Winogradskya consettensis]|uniref:Uncharacterized protein n=2 Tax=Winogradskya consettensis TaxID=113560 RepID=A0A919STB9_9ACTN|nr:hypothetical protein Aco04nite_51600 [Actinoplanes consettensis]